MSPTVGTDLCRVTIVAPRRRIDLSLPADVPLSHMLPSLLQAAGENLADQGLAHGGWALQRLDSAPFNPGQSLMQLGVRDGEVLYFRPRMAQIPEMSFDDVADVIATGIKERSDRWRPHTTRGFGLGAAVGMLIVGVVTLALSEPPYVLPALFAGAVAVVLLFAGIALSRAIGDAAAGAMLGYCALPYAFLAGLFAPARLPVPILEFGAPQLLSAFGVTILVAVIAAFGIADGLPNFFGIACTAIVGAVCAAVVLVVPDANPAGVGAVAIAIVLALSALVPPLSFRLARLPLPAVPANAEELRSDTQLVNGRAVLERTADADRFATGMVIGVALVALGAQTFLAFADGWIAPTMSLFVSLALLLRARVFRGRTQRGWMLVAGLAGLGMLDVSLAAAGSQALNLFGVFVPLLVTAAIAAAMGLWLPTRKPTPFWGRAGDIVDIIVIVTLIPLALGVLNIYQWVRGLAG